jgi:hypothetical protein
MGLFGDPELLSPEIHCFSKCHFCRKLIALKRDADDNLDFAARECPHCGVYIEQDRIEASFLENIWLTSSISSANKLQSLDLAFIPFLVVGVLSLAIGYPVSFRIMNTVLNLGPLILALMWFQKYWYRFRFDDPEYVDAVKGMKRSLLLWLVANILNWSLLLFQPTFIGDR